MTLRDDLLPLTFRHKAVEAIMGCVQAGESCTLVGIGSVGKSNLLRFLQRKDVRRATLGPEWESYLFVYVDVNKLLEKSQWGLLELMLHQLLIELTDRGVAEAALQTLDDLHQRATRPKTRYLALRYLDRAVRIACKRLGLRLVFLFDEFDDLCRSIAPRGFAAFRALRDDHKYRLGYVVAARSELRRLREEMSEIEAFEELVSPHTVWLGPHSEDDARLVLRRLEARHDVRLDDETANDVLAATGGHPGLLRTAYYAASELGRGSLDALAGNSHVQHECQRIWLSLTPKDQRAVVNLIGDALAQSHRAGALERLRRRGLVGGPWVSDDCMFSPLFEAYVRQQHPIIGARVHIDHERRVVWVDGREIHGLTPLEYKLIAYLEKRRGRVCARDEIAQYLYPEDMALEGDGVTENRIDAVVKRLRERVEPRPKEPRYIVTVRGHGFRLVDGDETGAN